MTLIAFLNPWFGQTFTDPRDGQKYKMIKIGDQIWMAENLRYVAPGSNCCRERDLNANLHPRASTMVLALLSTQDGQTSQRCCKEYGRLYDWQTAMVSAPPGWHLPSSEEWEKLIQFLGGSKKKAGRQLKQYGSSGFNAKMAGVGYPYLTRYPYERIVTVLDLLSFKSDTSFWSSTRLPERWRHNDYPTEHVLEYYLVYTYILGRGSDGISRQKTMDYRYGSIRCVKD